MDIQQKFEEKDLTDIYIYSNLIRNLGEIRKTLIHDVFKGKRVMVLNYNPHPSPRAGIAQIICPKENVGVVVEELRKRNIERLTDK